MVNKIIISIIFILPCISYADSKVNYLVSKELAKTPAIDYAIGEVKGPVKKMAVLNKNGTTSVSYNKNGRIEFIHDMHGLEFNHEFFYLNDDSQLPVGLKISTPVSYGLNSDITYLRDDNGNVLKIKRIDFTGDKIDKNQTDSFSYKQLPDGVVEVMAEGPSTTGRKLSYYKNGLLIKEVREDAKGINSKNEEITIPRFETVYKYKSNKAGGSPVFMSKEIFNSSGVLGYKLWEVYSNEGYITERNVSSFGDLSSVDSIKYVDYKFDKHLNWIERKKCEVWSGSEKSKPCFIESRTISYY